MYSETYNIKIWLEEKFKNLKNFRTQPRKFEIRIFSVVFFACVVAEYNKLFENLKVKVRFTKNV